MRRSRTISPTAAAVEFLPSDYFAPLDFRELFAREAPLEVDIGCGDGSYLLALAEKNRERNFLGLERLAGRIRSACKKIARRQLDNARVLLIDADYAVGYLLPRESVAAFHILFPDPWPKRRHERRRVVTPDFTSALHRALNCGGLVSIATDSANYFQEMKQTFDRSRLFVRERIDSRSGVSSTFERKFAAAAIYRLLLRKISDVR